MKIERIEEILSDPRLRAELLGDVDEDVLAEVAKLIEPVAMTQEELSDAWQAIQRRLEPPPSVRAMLDRLGRRLIGSAHAALQSWVAPAKEMGLTLRGALLAGHAVGHLGGDLSGRERPAVSIPLTLMPLVGGATEGLGCSVDLALDPDGRVRGSVTIPAGQIDAAENWRWGWLVLEHADYGLCVQYEVFAGAELSIPIDEPAPKIDFGDDLPLPMGGMKASLVQIG